VVTPGVIPVGVLARYIANSVFAESAFAPSR
ncbi:uncharacterized protein METZ01_LOCUS223453, partial [marine metagenome]